MSHNNETKWFMQLNIIEFMKSLTKYREIDSLDIFYEKANEFLGNDNAPSDPVLPENPQEAYALGKMLYRLGVYSDSEDWLKMGAEGGIAEAQVDYGYLLYRGCGKTQSFTEALKWYEAAMEQGDLTGLYRAMYMYRSGAGAYLRGDERCKEAIDNTTPEERGKSPEKLEQAEALLKRLADEGNLDALAMQESEGLSVDADVLEDIAESGNVRAMNTLANCYHLHIIPCEDSIERAVYGPQGLPNREMRRPCMHWALHMQTDSVSNIVPKKPSDISRRQLNRESSVPVWIWEKCISMEPEWNSHIRKQGNGS